MTIEKFLQELKVNGIKTKTLSNHRDILKRANEWKPLNDWTKTDVTTFILSLNLKPSTIELYKISIRKYFVWVGMPDIVAHLKIKMPKNNLRRADILTVDDVNLLIASTDSTLYKALIALLFESGARINEVMAVKVKDIQETDKGMVISIPQTKTGDDRRRVLVPFSSQYIRNHITYTALNMGDPLFDRHLTSIGQQLKIIGERADIKKPIHPHAFRHAQATDMVLRGYQESIIRKKLGWTGSSEMIARYEHIVDDDVINATAEKGGQDLQRLVLNTLNPGEALKIADASLQLSKLSEELQQEKEKREMLEKDMEYIHAIIKSGKLDEILKKS